MSTESKNVGPGARARTLGAVAAAVGAATVGYAAAVERRLYTLRATELPVFAHGAASLREDINDQSRYCIRRFVHLAHTFCS